MGAQHTSGPWHLDDYAIKSACGEVARVTQLLGDPFTIGDANARLIVAAPDLLAAVECAQGLNLPTEVAYPILRSHGFVYDPDLREADYGQACDFVNALCVAAIAKANGSAA